MCNIYKQISEVIYSERAAIASRCSDLLQAGRFGDRILVGARYSAPVQTGNGAHPASYTMCTGSFPRVNRPGVALSTHPHLVPRLRKG